MNAKLMSQKMCAPIALFAFNRPEHLRRTLDALAVNDLAPVSSLTIFCDGPRHNDELVLTNSVRAIAEEEVTKSRFASVAIIAKEKNQGLATSVISGVRQILKNHERVIVLEDDLLTSPWFLRFINEGLTLYADNHQVASIHGYGAPLRMKDPPQTYFLPGADCWGWGTWRRAWDVFQEDADTLLFELEGRGLRFAFNRDGACDYYGMLEDVRDGKISSWAIRWHASTFLAGMWTLHPGKSFVSNIGLDGSGTHCGINTQWRTVVASEPLALESKEVALDLAVYSSYKAFLRGLQRQGSLAQRIVNMLRSFANAWLEYRCC